MNFQKATLLNSMFGFGPAPSYLNINSVSAKSNDSTSQSNHSTSESNYSKCRSNHSTRQSNHSTNESNHNTYESINSTTELNSYRSRFGSLEDAFPASKNICTNVELHSHHHCTALCPCYAFGYCGINCECNCDPNKCRNKPKEQKEWPQYPKLRWQAQLQVPQTNYSSSGHIRQSTDKLEMNIFCRLSY